MVLALILVIAPRLPAQDIRSVPSPLMTFIAYQHRDVKWYHTMLADTSRVLEWYKTLSPEQKNVQLRKWYSEIKSGHDRLQAECDRKNVLPHYDEENSLNDLSKIDLFRLADSKPMIFHHTEKYLRLFYNAPGKGFTVKVTSDWPARLKNFGDWDYHGASGYLDNLNHNSFETELKRQSQVAIDWMNSSRP
jgi:hypothetical protein